MVKVGGPLRTVDFLRFSGPWACPFRALALTVRRLSRDRLCASVLDRRSVALNEAVTSGEGGSPKIKNLIKAARMRTTESCPRTRPCVKVSLVMC